jgi:thioredoxin 1
LIEPALRELEQEYQGRVDLVRLNADEDPESARDLGVIGIPTLIAVSAGGEEIARHTGAAPKPALARLFEAALSGQAPERAGRNLVDRLLLVVAGLALLSLSLRGGWSWLLAPFGVAVLFSAVADRCPLWRAVAPRLVQALQHWIQPSESGGSP